MWLHLTDAPRWSFKCRSSNKETIKSDTLGLQATAWITEEWISPQALMHFGNLHHARPQRIVSTCLWYDIPFPCCCWAAGRPKWHLDLVAHEQIAQSPDIKLVSGRWFPSGWVGHQWVFVGSVLFAPPRYIPRVTLWRHSWCGCDPREKFWVEIRDKQNFIG